MGSKIYTWIKGVGQRIVGPISPSAQRWLVICLLLGVGVRLLAAYLQPAFVDEAFVYYVTKAGLATLTEVIRYDNHPPTFNLVFYPLIKLTSSIFLLRLPAILFFACGLGAVFNLARRFFSERDALAVVAFMAISYSVWILETQLRSYGYLMFFLVFFWLGLADLRAGEIPLSSLCPTRPKRGWLFFTLAIMGACCLHLLGVAITLAGLITTFHLGSSSRRQAWLSWGLGLLPLGCWYAWALQHNSRIQEAHLLFSLEYWRVFLHVPLDVLNLVTADKISYCVRYLPVGAWCNAHLVPIYLALNALVWLWLIWGWIKLRRRDSFLADLAFSSIVVPLAALTAGSLVGLPHLQVRYATVVSLPFIVLLIEGLRVPWRRRGTGAILAVAGVEMLAFPFVPVLWNQYWTTPIKYIEEHQQDGDVIAVFVPYEAFSFCWAYDVEHLDFVFGPGTYQIKRRKSVGKLPVVMLATNPTPEELESMRGRRLFLVLSQAESAGGIPAWVGQHYRLVGHFGHRSLKNWADVETLLFEWER